MGVLSFAFCLFRLVDDDVVAATIFFTTTLVFACTLLVRHKRWAPFVGPVNAIMSLLAVVYFDQGLEIDGFFVAAAIPISCSALKQPAAGLAFGSAASALVFLGLLSTGSLEKNFVLWATSTLVIVSSAAVSRTLVKDRLRYEEQVLSTTKSLERALHKARVSGAAKDRFVAAVSHELRTPLHAVLGFSDALMTRELDDETEALVIERLHKNGQHLLSLITDILELARVEQGRISIELAHSELKNPVNESVELLRETARAKSLKVRVVIPPEKVSALIDEKRMRQILLNLLGNAIKFTDVGEVVVRLHSNGRIDVSDTGPGIKNEDLERIFKPFEQIDASLERSHEGTGLGLTLSRGFAERMGYSLSAQSNGARGATFSLIPMPKPQGP